MKSFGYLHSHCSHLDVEGSLESRCKEASEWSDERGKDGEGKGVELGRVKVHCQAAKLYMEDIKKH